MSRATGKTFRAVLRAVADASEGKFVVFVSRHRRDTYPQRYALAAANIVQEVATFYAAMKEVRFSSQGQLGRLRFTNIEDFTRDVREGRYQGIERTKFKVVFDDCGPDDYLMHFLAERAHD